MADKIDLRELHISDSSELRRRGLMEGTLKPGMEVKMMATGATYKVLECGIMRPLGLEQTDHLEAGQVGFFAVRIGGQTEKLGEEGNDCEKNRHNAAQSRGVGKNVHNDAPLILLTGGCPCFFVFDDDKGADRKARDNADERDDLPEREPVKQSELLLVFVVP